MNLGSWLVLGALAVWLVAAVVHIVRNRGSCCGCGTHRGKNHGSCGDCAACKGCGCQKDCGKSDE